MRRILSLVTLALVGIVSLSGCSSGSGGNAKSGETANAKPATLRIALVPSDDTEQMMAGFEPLRAYLEKTLEMPVEVRKVTNYGAVIEAMRKDRVDVAWYGPTAYVLAEKEANAEAFMVSVDKKGITTYQSYLLVPGSSPAKSIKDLAGKEVALVEAASTSGGLIPSYMILKETGEQATKFCHINYVGNHDAVVNVVKNGSVAAGATNNLTVDRMVEQGKVKTSDFRILQKSDPIPGSPLAWRKSLDPSLKEKIASAIMSSPKALGTYSIAGFGEIASFQRTTPASYQIIRDLVEKLALKREDLLK